MIQKNKILLLTNANLRLNKFDSNKIKKMNKRQKSVDELIKNDYKYKPKKEQNIQKIKTINLQAFINKEKKIDNKKVKIKNQKISFDKLYNEDIINQKQKNKRINNIYSPTFTQQKFRFTIDNICRHEEIYNKNNKQNKNINISIDISNNHKNSFKNHSKNKLNHNNSLNFINNDFEGQIKLRVSRKLKDTRNNSAINLMKKN